METPAMKFVIYYLEADGVACELPCIVGTYSRRNVAEMRLAEFTRGRDPRFDSWYWLAEEVPEQSPARAAMAASGYPAPGD